MSPRTTKAGATVSRRRQTARHLIAQSFVKALTENNASHGAAARWLKVSLRTVRYWVHGQRPISVEVVLASPRIGKAFRQALCVHAHDDSEGLG